MPLPTPAGLKTSALALPGNASVNDEVARAGVGFGALVGLTGQAVAATQAQLNETGAAMTSALATTLVDVIAVQETVYDDQGTPAQAKSHVRKLPLINFVDPVFYEWTNVRLQGTFFAREFATAGTRHAESHTETDVIAQGGIVLGLGGGYNRNRTSTTTTDTTSTATSDVSYGRVRMNARLQPKRDIGVPAPRQVVRGPSLSVVAGEVTDVKDGGVLVARTMSALIELRSVAGAPIAGKAVSIETDGVAWHFTGDGATDAAGNVAVEMRREFLDPDADTAPANVVVSARLGLVSNSTTLTF